MLDKTKPKKVVAKNQARASATTKSTNKKIASSKQKTASKSISPEQRQQMIEEAAYYIAEKKGFEAHSILDNWLAAEAEIDNQFSQKLR